MGVDERIEILLSIFQLGEHEWNLLRESKGDWPEDKRSMEQYRDFTMPELIGAMKFLVVICVKEKPGKDVVSGDIYNKCIIDFLDRSNSHSCHQ